MYRKVLFKVNITTNIYSEMLKCSTDTTKQTGNILPSAEFRYLRHGRQQPFNMAPQYHAGVEETKVKRD